MKKSARKNPSDTGTIAGATKASAFRQNHDVITTKATTSASDRTVRPVATVRF